MDISRMQGAPRMVPLNRKCLFSHRHQNSSPSSLNSTRVTHKSKKYQIMKLFRYVGFANPGCNVNIVVLVN